MIRKLIPFLSAATLMTATGGCVDRQAQKEARKTEEFVTNPTKLVRVRSVKEETLVQTQEITGGVTTGEDTQVGSKIAGRLVAVYVKDGDPVTAGQVIAVQDTSTLNDQLSAALAGLAAARAQLSQAVASAAVGPMKSSSAVAGAQAQLRSAKAALQKARAGARPEERAQTEWQVRSAKSALDLAKTQLDRQRELFGQGATARQQLDQAQNAYDSALTAYNGALQAQMMQVNGTRPEDLAIAEEAVRAAEENLRSAEGQKKLDVLLSDQVQSAQAGVQTANAQVSIAKQAVADAQIRAPFSGHVSGKPMQVGTMASPGQTVARIIGGQGAYFEAQVSEDVVSQLTLGSPVAINIDALPDMKFDGSIAAVSPLGTEVGRLFTVRVTFRGDVNGIKPGMYARGVVQLKKIPNAVLVPVTAVQQSGGENVVFVVEGDKAKMIKVKTGIRQQDVIQVTGLQSGQQLVIQGQETLVDGSKITVDKTGAVSASLKSKTVRG